MTRLEMLQRTTSLWQKSASNGQEDAHRTPLEIAGGVAGGVAAGGAAHKAIDYAATKFLRDSRMGRKLSDNYYRNLVREGLISGATGTDLMPAWRRGIGIGISPSVTGLADYEIARLAGMKMREKFPDVEVDKMLNNATPEIKAWTREHISKDLGGNNRSPLSRNLYHGVVGNYGKSKLVDLLRKTRSLSIPSQNTRWLAPLISAVVGAGMHGPTGAIGATLGNLPDIVVGAAADSNRVSTIENLKMRLIDKGYESARAATRKAPVGKLRGLVDAVGRQLFSLSNPSSEEVYRMGKDLFRSPGNVVTPIPTSILTPAARLAYSATIRRHATQPVLAALIKDFPQVAKSVSKWSPLLRKLILKR